MAADPSIFPKPDILNEMPYGKFVLANLAAKRAKQIREGAPPLVRIASAHPLSIALAEIAAGKIKPQFGADEAALIESDDLAVLEDPEGLLLPGLDDDEDDTSLADLELDDLEDLEIDDDDAAPNEDGDPSLDEITTDDDEDDSEGGDSSTMSLDDLKSEEEAGAEDDS